MHGVAQFVHSATHLQALQHRDRMLDQTGHLVRLEKIEHLHLRYTVLALDTTHHLAHRWQTKEVWAEYPCYTVKRVTHWALVGDSAVALALHKGQLLDLGVQGFAHGAFLVAAESFAHQLSLRVGACWLR
jgi:hypothetical protein